MKKRAVLFKPLFLIPCIAIGIICFIIYFYNYQLFVVSSAIAVVAFILVIVRLFFIQKDVNQFLREMSDTIGNTQEDSLIQFPLPVIITDEKGEIVWYNNRCAEVLFEDIEYYGRSISDVLGSATLTSKEMVIKESITFSDSEFTIYGVGTETAGNLIWTYYLVDDTKLKQDSKEYSLSKPSVIMITIDSYDEVLQNCKENERSQLLSQVEYYIEKFTGECEGIVIKNDRDRYIAIIEERFMNSIISKRFEILDQVRNLSVGERTPLTLSIGVGRGGNSYGECEQTARQSLDMALGRGGDQAAVKTNSGYDFYGGVSKGVEKRTKVKTRIVATALMELIESSSNVIVMGHKFADLDCFGAAVGLLKSIRQMGKNAHIAISRSKNLVFPLLDRLENNGYDGAFLEPEALLSKVDAKTLLIIVDTHLVHVVESRELYNACQNIVVIDHHRRMVGYIENAVIFYHEPYASSASEMVSELVQYFGDKNRIGRIEAEALLAGIMLDTKNFIIKTGVRTFEAAAFLRRQGADTVEVRKLFSSSMDAYQHRSRLVASAEIYRRCAIAQNNVHIDDIKIVAPQAADELLGISDVDASFVLYEYNKGVTFSARSMGKMNVQMVMEHIGGGGHQTMAGAQLENTNIEAARQLLLEAIDNYFDNTIAR